MKKINKTLIDKTSAGAKTSARKRLNCNFHQRLEDPINRMLNAVEVDAYFPPHTHKDPDKREVFIILQGKVVAVEFSADGEVIDHIILDTKEGNFGVEFGEGSWHSIIPLESSVLYEIKDGPYDKASDKTFAQWAPSEEDPKAWEFVDKIRSEIGV